MGFDIAQKELEYWGFQFEKINLKLDRLQKDIDDLKSHEVKHD